MRWRVPDAAVEIVHFADPWCWWSWGLEPVLQRLREVYGTQVKISYKMGGITDDVSQWRREYHVNEDAALRAWAAESISATGMPADPNYFLVSGVTSTLPACAAVKAAQMQSEERGEHFFRRLVEEIQLASRNGSDESVYLEVARKVGLDPVRLRRDIASGSAYELLEKDRRAMDSNFLTLTYIGTKTKRTQTVSGVFAAREHEEAVLKVTDQPLVRKTPVDILDYLERHEGFRVPTKEIAEVFSTSPAEAHRRLLALAAAGKLDQHELSFGATCWSRARRS